MIFKRILKTLLGIFLIPASISFSISLFEQIGKIQTLHNAQAYFLYGVASYAFVHLVLFRPVYLYVLGHEVMHVIAAWMCGGKAGKFKVSSKGGSVETSKSNFFIALAPYFFPTYALLFSLVLAVASIFLDISRYFDIFIFVLAFTLTFHFIMTVEMVKKKQPDIIKTGYLFSINLIYLINIIMLALVLSAIFKEVNFLELLTLSIRRTKNVYLAIFNQLF